MTGATPDDLAPVRDAVARVGARIQPLLEPHPGLAQRNAFAHIWLGIKVRFGEDWKAQADADSLLEFIDWLDRHPNDDYEDWPGPPRHRATPRVRESITAAARAPVRARRDVSAGLFDEIDHAP